MFLLKNIIAPVIANLASLHAKYALPRTKPSIDEIVPRDGAMARLAYEAWLCVGKGWQPAPVNFGHGCSYALAKLRDDPLFFNVFLVLQFQEEPVSRDSR